MRHFKIFVLVLSLAVFASGCAIMLGAAAGGAGTKLWLSGKLSETFNVPYNKVLEATRQGLKSLDMDIKKETMNSEVVQVISEYKDGSKVWIDIRPVSTTSSKIEIRVGVWGDKSVSSAILKQINRKIIK